MAEDLTFPADARPARRVRRVPKRRRRFSLARKALRLVVFGPGSVVLASVGVVALLRWVPPPTTSFLLQWRVAHGRAPAHDWVPWNQLSPDLALAVVAAEDQKFAEHVGFDIDAINDAMDERRSGGRVRGASTITQQVAKNLFLWPERTWLRKGIEAWFTVWIELLWPKKRILETYLNVAEFGPGVFGAQAAARSYFGKPAAKLDRREAALLAAVLPNPTRLSAVRPSYYVLERQEWIIRQMGRLGGWGYLANLSR